MLLSALVRSFGPIFPLADQLVVTKREQRMAESEQEIERMQRTEEATVVATGAARERGRPPWVVLGVKAVGARAIPAA